MARQAPTSWTSAERRELPAAGRRNNCRCCARGEAGGCHNCRCCARGETPAAAEPMPAAAVTKTGAGPDDALTASGEWAPLVKGQKVWYALPQDGGGSKILVRMAVDPKNAGSFKILTPENVRLWAAGQKYEPSAAATSDAFGGDQVWTGSFKTPGAYYIVVEQTGANEGGYKLSVQ